MALPNQSIRCTKCGPAHVVASALAKYYDGPLLPRARVQVVWIHSTLAAKLMKRLMCLRRPSEAQRRWLSVLVRNLEDLDTWFGPTSDGACPTRSSDSGRKCLSGLDVEPGGQNEVAHSVISFKLGDHCPIRSYDAPIGPQPSRGKICGFNCAGRGPGKLKNKQGVRGCS